MIRPRIRRLVAVLLFCASASCAGVEPGDAPDAGPSQCTDDVDCPIAPDGPVEIPSGAFMMGCNPGAERACDADEGPYHSISLSTYKIDRTETAKAAYYKCVDAGVCTPPAHDLDALDIIDLGQYPVVGVTWEQAATYCRWTGRRLPTEAEWERAARGDDARVWPWGNLPPDCQHANYGDCGRPLVSVTSLTDGANPRGALHMAGNAAEWVGDWYDANVYAGMNAAQDPTGPPSGVARVVRGGSFKSNAHDVRTADRGFAAPDFASAEIGFRCVLGISTGPGIDY